jgi:hypothetical protein
MLVDNLLANLYLHHQIIAVITPYLVGEQNANLRSKVFWIWFATCCICFVYAYLFVWETKGLTLEQVDRMMEECGSPRRSPGWQPSTTFVEQRRESLAPNKTFGDNEKHMQEQPTHV